MRIIKDHKLKKSFDHQINTDRDNMPGAGFDHTFAICAYKESPYLERCIESVMNQDLKTNVILCTSTPGTFIRKMAEKYNIPLHVRDGVSSISDDWNYAYRMARTAYVTVTHQDDIYRPDYAREIAKRVKTSPKNIIAYTDYMLIDQNDTAGSAPALWVKRILNFPLLLPGLYKIPFGKRCALRMGNAICCPSVCYHKSRITKIRKKRGLNPEIVFDSDMSYALDWDTFTALSDYPGSFLYVPKPVFQYRIHEESTSTACLRDHRKTKEEIAMFSKFWPKPVVKLLMIFYKLSYGAYK